MYSKLMKVCIFITAVFSPALFAAEGRTLVNSSTITEPQVVVQVSKYSWSLYIASFVANAGDIRRIGYKNYCFLEKFLQNLENGYAVDQENAAQFNQRAQTLAKKFFASAMLGQKNYRGTGFTSEIRSLEFAYGHLRLMLLAIVSEKDCPESFKVQAAKALGLARIALLNIPVLSRVMSCLETYGQKMLVGFGIIFSIAVSAGIFYAIYKFYNVADVTVDKSVNMLSAKVDAGLDKVSDKLDAIVKDVNEKCDEEGVLRMLVGKKDIPENSPAGRLVRSFTNLVDSYQADNVLKPREGDNRGLFEKVFPQMPEDGTPAKQLYDEIIHTVKGVRAAAESLPRDITIPNVIRNCVQEGAFKQLDLRGRLSEYEVEQLKKKERQRAGSLPQPSGRERRNSVASTTSVPEKKD